MLLCLAGSAIDIWFCSTEWSYLSYLSIKIYKSQIYTMRFCIENIYCIFSLCAGKTLCCATRSIPPEERDEQEGRPFEERIVSWVRLELTCAISCKLQLNGTRDSWFELREIHAASVLQPLPTDPFLGSRTLAHAYTHMNTAGTRKSRLEGPKGKANKLLHPPWIPLKPA